MTRPDVEGSEWLVAKHSQVRGDGSWRATPIEGLKFRPTRPVPHEDGTVTEIARRDWDEIDQDIVHVHVTTTQPGRVRAWGLHQHSTDRLVVIKGLVSIVVYDGRNGSPTRGALNEYKLSERNPGIVVVPPNLYHGWKNIGTDEAFIVNMPSSAYHYDGPDALDLPYDHPQAETVVPWRW